MNKLWLVVVGAIAILMMAAISAWTFWPHPVMHPDYVAIDRYITQGENDREARTKMPCEPNTDLRTSELCAYWKASDAAKSSAYAAWWAFGTGTVLSVLTLVGLWFTYNATRSQVEIAEKTFSAQVRAWIEVGVALEGGWEPGKAQVGGDGIYLNILGKMKNYGTSPATNVSFHADVRLMREGMGSPTDIMQGFVEERRNIGIGAVFPGGELPGSHMGFISMNEINQFIAGKENSFIFPFIVGCVFYNSPHIKHQCETRFLYNLGHVRNGQTFAVEVKEGWLSEKLYLFLPAHVIAT